MCIAETAYKFSLGADWMNDYDSPSPLSDSLFLNVLTMYPFNKLTLSPDLQPKAAHIRPDLPRLDVSPERRSTDDLQRT
jgi:hypothetical protein